MNQIFAGKGVVVIDSPTVAMGAYAGKYIPVDSRLVVKPFFANVTEMAMFGVVAVVSTE